MSGIQKIILIGNLGKDPEIHTFEDGSKKASFSLAVSESYKNKAGEKVESTEWFNIACFNGLAGVVENYLKKGSKVYIEGKNKTRSYDDKDGNKKYYTEVICNNLNMLGSLGDTSQQNTQQPDAQSSDDDDLPF